MYNNIVVGMAGSGGDGIVSAGESLIQAAAAEGYHAMMTKSFGSQIRGGESSCRVRLVDRAACSTRAATLDVAVALNWEDFLKFGAELPGRGSDRGDLRGRRPASPRARDPARGRDAEGGLRGAHRRDGQGRPPAPSKAKNTVVLGLIAGWFGIARACDAARAREEVRPRRARSWCEANERAFAPASSSPRSTRSQRRAAMATPPPSGTGQAAHRRQRHVRRRRRSSPAASSSAATPSPRPPR